MRTPLVEAEQYGSIRIQDPTKVVMRRSRLGLTEERLVPFEAAGNVSDPDDRPCAFHRVSAVGLTKISLQPVLSPSTGRSFIQEFSGDRLGRLAGLSTCP